MDATAAITGNVDKTQVWDLYPRVNCTCSKICVPPDTAAEPETHPGLRQPFPRQHLHLSK